MNRPVSMTKIRLTGLKSDLPSVIDTLYDLRLLHIVDFDKDKYEGLEYGKPFEQAGQLSDHLVKVQALGTQLGIKTGQMPDKNKAASFQHFSSNHHSFSLLFERFSEAQARQNALIVRQTELQNRLHEDAGQIHSAKKLRAQNASVTFISGTAKKDVKPILANAKLDFELVQEKKDGLYAVALFVPVRQAKTARAVLASAHFSEKANSKAADREAVETELGQIEAELAQVRETFERMRNDHTHFLSEYAHSLRQLNEKAECPLRFGETASAFVATGWVPTQKANQIREALKAHGDKVHIEFSSTGANAPVALKNPKALKPFEFFLNLYTLPDYHEIDPTVIMAITFPLFFGFMLGDVGYGIVTLALFWFLRSKTSGMLKALCGPLIWASVATIAFGLVFGEFFGYEYTHEPILNRVHDPTTVLGVAILVGFIHLNLGLVIGFFNELKSHGLKHAFFAKLSWMVLELGIVLIALDATGLVSLGGPMAGLGIAAAAIAMIYLGEGPKGIVELPALLSNMLSYGRLFAVGLASVSLALVTNQMAGAMIEGGPVGLVIAIIVLVIGHALNIALGILGPSLHAIRLHYVEFFSKFYRGGGEKYAPFGLKEEI